MHADGRFQKRELEGLRRAARLHGLSEEQLARIESRAQQETAISRLEFPELSDFEKALTYAFAVWIAKVDGIINREENEMLKQLGERLGLDKLRRDAARSATYDISALPGGHQPESFDLKALETHLEAKLPGSFKRHQRASSAKAEETEISADDLEESEI